MSAPHAVVEDWTLERKTRVGDLIRQLYSLVSALEKEFEGRRFTPDGHLVGSIGEVVAAYAFGLHLLPSSTETHDAVSSDGKFVQIKFTGGDTAISMYSEPDYLLVLQLRNGKFVTAYNGVGSVVWQNCRPPQKNGQRSIALSKLRKLDAESSEKLRQVNPYPLLRKEA